MSGGLSVGCCRALCAASDKSKENHMLSMFKIVLASALAVFAFVVAASSASAAPSWSVAGTKVATGEKFTIAEAATLSVENSLI